MNAPVARTSSSPLGFLERLYLFEVVKGMLITLRHMTRNLIVQLRAHPEERFRAIEYPEMRKVKCVACMCCAQICPARCITIVAGEDADDPIEKFPVEFTIDMLGCIYCGFCVEACPKDAIRMDTGIYEINAFNRQDMIHNKTYMVDLMDGGKPEAGKVYRQHPELAPAGYRQDETTVT